MTASNPNEIVAVLRTQHAALLELVDIALTALRESGEASVSSMHAIARLNRVADSLKRSAGAARGPSAGAAARR